MSSDPTHVFVIDDDVAVRELLRDRLQRAGHVVTSLESAEALATALELQQPDVLVLDVSLPGRSGLDACRSLRATGDDTPVILISARSGDADRVLGLRLGADDYLCKPFGTDELLARIDILRRRARLERRAPPNRHRSIQVGRYAFVPGLRALIRGDDTHVLGGVEFSLLKTLTAHPMEIMSRARLLEAIAPAHPLLQQKSIDAAMLRLRRRVEPNPAVPRYLQAVRGEGYVFVPAGAFV